MLFLCAIIGIVVGFVLVFSNTSFVNLLTSSNKKLYTLINGTADYMGLFWKKFLSFSFPLVLLFLLSLNYYLGVICYLFITYQFALFIMSCAAVVKLYAMAGFLNVFFIMIPINLMFFAVLFYVTVTLLRRTRMSHKYKDFWCGFDNEFWIKLLASVLILASVALLACVILPMFLKNSIFIVF